MEVRESSARSADGTRIGWVEAGSGTALAMFHGLGGTRERWLPVMPGLAKAMRVLAVDRRGRGLSGDTQPYAYEREFEDALAVAGAAGPGVVLFGHSGGGPLVLEAALRSPNVARVIVYEGWPRESAPVSGELLARMERLVAGGRNEEALETFIREVLEFDDAMVQKWRTSPAWPSRVAAAHATARELRAWDEYGTDLERYAAIDVPVTLLAGDAGPEALEPSIERFRAAVPQTEVVVLPGQGHVAMDSAPDLFVQTVREIVKA